MLGKPQFRLIATFVVCVSSLVLVIRSQVVERPAARMLETGLELVTGEQAIVGALNLDPVRRTVEVTGLILSHSDPQGAQAPIVAAERVAVRFGLPWSGAWVHTLEIDRPVVRLHIDEDGLREFQKMELSGGDTDSLPWARIRVKNARVDFETAMGTLLLEGVDVETTELERVDMNVDTVRIQFPGLDEVARKVNWRNVALTPNKIEIPDLRIESQHVRLQGDLAAHFGGSLRGNMTASVALSMLDALGKGSFEGMGHLDVEMGGTFRDPKVDGTVLVSNVVHSGEKKTLELERLLAQVTWQGRTFTINDSEVYWAAGKLLTRGEIDLVSSEIQVNTNFENIDLRSAIREAGGHQNSWTTFSGDGEIDVTGRLTPFELSGEYAIALQDLDVGSGPPDGPETRSVLFIPTVELNGALDVDSEGIWLRSDRARSGATSGRIDAFIGFNSYGPLDVEYAFDRTSLATFRPLNDLDLWGFGRLRGTVKGPFKKVRFTADGAVRDFQMMGAPLADKVRVGFVCNDLRTLEFTQFKGNLGLSEYIGHADVTIADEVTMDVGVELIEGRIEDLLRIGGDGVPWLHGNITGLLNLAGTPSAIGGDFDGALRDVEVAGEKFPSGAISGWLDAGSVHIGHLSLDRWNGEEGAIARGTIAPDWTANIDVTATGFQLNRLNNLEAINAPIDGTVTVDAQIQGSLLDPQPAGRMAVSGAKYADFDLPDSTVQFTTVEDEILLEGNLVGNGLRFDGALKRSADRPFSLGVRLEEFPLHSAYPLGADGTDISALLSGRLQLDGTLGGQPSLDLFGEGRVLEILWDRHRLHTLAPWEFELSGKAMRLSGFRLQGAGTDLEWEVQTDASGGLSGSGGGVVDADLARMFVDGLQRADGGVAVHLGVGGTLANPHWMIDAGACGVTIQGEWFPHPFEDIQGVVGIQSNGTRIRAFEPREGDAVWADENSLLAPCSENVQNAELIGRLGDGDFSLVGGFDASEWWPQYFDFEAEVQNARVQYLSDLPPFVGSALLELSGPTRELLLAGTIDVSEMIFSERISWEEWLLELTDSESMSMDLEAEDALFAMDIAMRSEDTIRMRNNVADFTAGGELRVVGDTNEPGLVGSVRAVPGGRVYLKEREFEVQRGEIHFVDPFSFDPDLDLMLLTDVRSREDEYAVTYRVSGTYNDWRAETRSEPSLPAADVNALLLFGMTRAELERYGGLGGALAVEGGDILASSFLFSGRPDTDRGALFRIVDPLRPERLDLVSGVSERGSGAVSSDLRLLYENDLADVGLRGSLMIFEQNITRASDTYLGFEQRLARTLFARTYWGSEQVGRYLDAGGAYGVEMKVRWELD